MPREDFWKPFYEKEDNPPWDLGEVSPAIRELFDQHGPAKGARVLVPGSGKGHDAIWLARAGYEVVAVDFISKAIDHARTMAKDARAHMELVQANVLELPQEWDETFDAVAEHTCYAAIDPTDLDSYIGQLYRVLKPGGRVLGVWFDLENFPGREDPMDGPPFPSTRAQIQERFEKAGFTTELLEPTSHGHGDKPLSQAIGIFAKAAK